MENCVLHFELGLTDFYVHLSCVYGTRGFKRPRELPWVMGVVLAVLATSFGVTGYSIPWDQIGFWAVKIEQLYLKLLL